MSWEDRRRAARRLQIAPVGSGYRRSVGEERLIDLHEWLRVRSPGGSVPVAAVHELVRCPVGRYVTITEGRVAASTEQDILDRLHEGRTVTVLRPPRELTS